MLGYVKNVRHDKGFGFITGDDKVDYFFHRTQTLEHCHFELMAPGQRVEFDTEPHHPKGPRAVAISMASQ
jgi:cold shock CspA family protein